MTTQELLQERDGLVNKQADMLIEARKTEKGTLTADQATEWKNMDARVAEIEITAEADKAVQAAMGKSGNEFNALNLDKEVEDQTLNDGGFANFGEHLIAIANQASPGGSWNGAGQVDPRLHAMMNAATGHGTTVPSDGGFLVTPTRSNEIMQRAYEGGAITSRCATFDVGAGSDTLEVPYVDETSRANGSRWGGIRAYRKGEAEAGTESKTKIGLWECRVQDLDVLTYVTERQLEDGPALEQLIMDLVPQEFTFKLEDEILSGDGAAQNKGIIGDTATVSVAKETGQAATTLVHANIVKMWARAWGRSRGKGAWFYNQDIEPALNSMFLAVGTGGVPVYMPANGLSATPFGTLMGSPAISVEQASTLGTVGDIMFADFNEYALVRKGGMRSASSMHVRFIQDEMVFKFKMRVSGKPKWKTALTPFKGSNTQSPFVTLATRS